MRVFMCAPVYVCVGLDTCVCMCVRECVCVAKFVSFHGFTALPWAALREVPLFLDHHGVQVRTSILPCSLPPPSPPPPAPPPHPHTHTDTHTHLHKHTHTHTYTHTHTHTREVLTLKPITPQNTGLGIAFRGKHATISLFPC
jgi:hypothetical protein